MEEASRFVWKLGINVTLVRTSVMRRTSVPAAQARNSQGEHKLISCLTAVKNIKKMKYTYSRLELFQYTACRSLPLDWCKFASASVTRLRENVRRAIIPLRCSSSPWIPSCSFCVPPLLLVPVSLTTSRRSVKPFELPGCLFIYLFYFIF